MLCSSSPDEPHKSKEVQDATKPSVRFNLRTSKDPEHEGCYLSLGHNRVLEDCGFNMTAKTFFIIHGWTVSPGWELCGFIQDLLPFVLVN
jgi:triacylglycerol lipase